MFVWGIGSATLSWQSHFPLQKLAVKFFKIHSLSDQAEISCIWYLPFRFLRIRQGEKTVPHFFSPFLQQVKYLEVFANTLAFPCLTLINSTQGQHFQTLLCLAVALKSYANLAKLGSHKNHFVQLMINKSLENHPFIQSMLYPCQQQLC